MRSRLFSHGDAVLVLVPFLALGCNDSAPPANPDPIAPPVAAATPTPPPAPVGCNAGPGTPNNNCVRLGQAFLRDVDDAINRLVARRPELFILDDTSGPGAYFVRNSDEYYREVVVELRQAGFCAVAHDGEIGVKMDNSFSEQFDIMMSVGYVRRGPAMYRSTCIPAWF